MATTKDLMRQKVNVNEVLLNHWDKNMAFNLRNLINKWLIKNRGDANVPAVDQWDLDALIAF